VSSASSGSAQSLSPLSKLSRRQKKWSDIKKRLSASVTDESGSHPAVKLVFKLSSASNKQPSIASKTASAVKLRYSSIIATRRSSAAAAAAAAAAAGKSDSAVTKPEATAITDCREVKDCVVNIKRFVSSNITDDRQSTPVNCTDEVMTTMSDTPATDTSDQSSRCKEQFEQADSSDHGKTLYPVGDDMLLTNSLSNPDTAGIEEGKENDTVSMTVTSQCQNDEGESRAECQAAVDNLTVEHQAVNAREMAAESQTDSEDHAVSDSAVRAEHQDVSDSWTVEHQTDDDVATDGGQAVSDDVTAERRDVSDSVTVEHQADSDVTVQHQAGGDGVTAECLAVSDSVTVEHHANSDNNVTVEGRAVSDNVAAECPAVSDDVTVEHLTDSDTVTADHPPVSNDEPVVIPSDGADDMTSEDNTAECHNTSDSVTVEHQAVTDRVTAECNAVGDDVTLNESDNSITVVGVEDNEFNSVTWKRSNLPAPNRDLAITDSHDDNVTVSSNTCLEKNSDKGLTDTVENSALPSSADVAENVDVGEEQFLPEQIPATSVSSDSCISMSIPGCELRKDSTIQSCKVGAEWLPAVIGSIVTKESDSTLNPVDSEEVLEYLYSSHMQSMRDNHSVFECSHDSAGDNKDNTVNSTDVNDVQVEMECDDMADDVVVAGILSTGTDLESDTEATLQNTVSAECRDSQPVSACIVTTTQLHSADTGTSVPSSASRFPFLEFLVKQSKVSADHEVASQSSVSGNTSVTAVSVNSTLAATCESAVCSHPVSACLVSSQSPLLSYSTVQSDLSLPCQLSSVTHHVTLGSSPSSAAAEPLSDGMLLL